MPTFKLYKDGKEVQGQFYLLYNLFFFFQKIKTFGVETIDKRLWKKCVILMECWSWPLFIALATVKVICYFHMWRYHVFAQKLTWYFIGVYMKRENKQWFCYKQFWWVLRLILWKNLESLSTNEFQSKKPRSHKCNSLLKLKYSPSIAGLHVMWWQPCWWPCKNKALLSSGN